MTSAWQSCQGDYKPESQFERSNQMVIVRNLTQVDDGLWQWEEYAMDKDDYETISVLIAENNPYTETKTAYYNETEKTFYGVPAGDVSVNFGNYHGDYSINRVSDRVTVSFNVLTESTSITITVK